jgi:hypothetical protein
VYFYTVEKEGGNCDTGIEVHFCKRGTNAFSYLAYSTTKEDALHILLRIMDIKVPFILFSQSSQIFWL